MKALTLVCGLLLSTSYAAAAETIHSIRIFHTDEVPVVEDVSMSTALHVQVYNMDTQKNATATLNAMVKAKLGSKVDLGNYREANQQAFSEVQNGPNWQKIYSELELASKAVEFAIRFQIKKLPAIVFNDHSVIYGVTSLQQAIQIYNNKEDAKGKGVE